MTSFTPSNNKRIISIAIGLFSVLLQTQSLPGFFSSIDMSSPTEDYLSQFFRYSLLLGAFLFIFIIPNQTISYTDQELTIKSLFRSNSFQINGLESIRYERNELMSRFILVGTEKKRLVMLLMNRVDLDKLYDFMVKLNPTAKIIGDTSTPLETS